MGEVLKTTLTKIYFDDRKSLKWKGMKKELGEVFQEVTTNLLTDIEEMEMNSNGQKNLIAGEVNIVIFEMIENEMTILEVLEGKVINRGSTLPVDAVALLGVAVALVHLINVVQSHLIDVVLLQDVAHGRLTDDVLDHLIDVVHDRLIDAVQGHLTDAVHVPQVGGDDLEPQVGKLIAKKRTSHLKEVQNLLSLLQLKAAQVFLKHHVGQNFQHLWSLNQFQKKGLCLRNVNAITIFLILKSSPFYGSESCIWKVFTIVF